MSNAPQNTPATPEPTTTPQRKVFALTPMERIMILFTVFFGLGILLYSTLPEGLVRGTVIGLYSAAFVFLIYKPLSFWPSRRKDRYIECDQVLTSDA